MSFFACCCNLIPVAMLVAGTTTFLLCRDAGATGVCGGNEDISTIGLYLVIIGGAVEVAVLCVIGFVCCIGCDCYHDDPL